MSDKKHIIREDFNSIHQMLDIITSRPNNHVMRNEKSSKTGSKSFTGTESWEEAIDLFHNGYTEILPQIKEGVRMNNKVTFNEFNIKRTPPTNMPIGFVPHVPNAIQNKPDSMINIIRTPQKRKTLSVIYDFSANAWVSTEDFEKAGIALLGALNIIEKNGIQTKLVVSFFTGEAGDEYVLPTVKIKDYGERFNLQKVAFPLAHPSMFRRFGFKYLETCPELTSSGFSSGYGHTPESEEVNEVFGLKQKNEYLITFYDIYRYEYDIKKILQHFNFIDKEERKED